MNDYGLTPAARSLALWSQPREKRGRWRKLKGVASVELRDGTVRLAELHWYEAHGIGRYEYKIKTYLD